MRTFSKILVALFGVLVGLFIYPSVASASDVEVSVDDFDGQLTFGYSSTYQPSGTVTAYELTTRSLLRSSAPRIGADFDDAFQVYQGYAVNPSYLPLTDKLFSSVNYGNAYPVSITSFDLGIDYTLPALQGYYTVAYDIYFGVSVYVPRGNQNNTLTNIFTVDPSPYQWEDQNGHTFQILYQDDNPSITFTANGYTQTSTNFIHLRAYYIGVDSDETISLHLLEYFNTHIGTWSAQGVYGNGYDIPAYSLQAFFVPEVTYLPEPPATPTPVPTPYPGQDTQESINQGVQVIVDVLDVSATPLPHPDELQIDETLFDSLESMTLPDVSPATDTFANLWTIFDPLWAFIGMLAGSLLVVGIFLYLLKGNFI